MCELIPERLTPERLAPALTEAIERCALDLSGLTVLTEAASGPYVVTPLLAALAGARQVFAVTRDSRWGTAEGVRRETEDLARDLGAADRLRVVVGRPLELAGEADLVTNSGHLRPLDHELVERLKPTAVIPLMYEAWELRETDLDLAACRRRGIAVAGTNETHPAVGVFPFLGAMAAHLFSTGGLSFEPGPSLLVVCDNPFAPFLESGLQARGADVVLVADAAAALREAERCLFDGVLIAATPGDDPVCHEGQLRQLDEAFESPLFAQLWGDVERPGGARFVPAEPPAPGHMGLLPSALGPEPVIRLQSGGLKVGEVLARLRRRGLSPAEAESEVEAQGWGQRLAG